MHSRCCLGCKSVLSNVALARKESHLKMHLCKAGKTLSSPVCECPLIAGLKKPLQADAACGVTEIERSTLFTPRARDGGASDEGEVCI